MFFVIQQNFTIYFYYFIQSFKIHVDNHKHPVYTFRHDIRQHYSLINITIYDLEEHSMTRKEFTAKYGRILLPLVTPFGKDEEID